MSLRPAAKPPAQGGGATAQRSPAVVRLAVLLLLAALLPLHALAPFLHAHTEADPRAGMQAGLHLPGLEALEDEARDGPAFGLRNPPLIEEADLGRRQTASDLDDAPAPARDNGPVVAAQSIVLAGRSAAPPRQPPPAPPARAPPPGISVHA